MATFCGGGHLPIFIKLSYSLRKLPTFSPTVLTTLYDELRHPNSQWTYREEFFSDGHESSGVVSDAVEAGAHQHRAEDVEEHLQRVLVQEVHLVQGLHREVYAAARLKQTRNNSTL